ncbi:heterodisulfide reductase-related iron-sulfur binding cluster, partial [Proteus faecis]|uniref:heterodisulfide reductase-related iron-sulfur binding cluster n=1 Tax=Proteus faecis TaxID=2050967 RepID=UPI003D8018A1
MLPFANSETCCGFGGTFSVKMSEISGEMVTEKVKHIMDVFSVIYLVVKINTSF